jgi:hypothetical protein
VPASVVDGIDSVEGGSLATLEEVLDQLATAPPSEFTRERNALVARLTKLGQNDAAARVKAVPRPTVAVWVVNRLAREEPKAVEQLITAAEHMRAAQLRRGDLRAASASHRATLAHLSERAGAMLRELGVGATHKVLLRVETTLTAAAADRELRRALRKGRLEREVAARGFEVFAGEKLPPAPRGKVQAHTPKEGTAAIDESRASRPADIVATERQDARLKEASGELARAEAEAAKRNEQLTVARQRVTELRQLLQQATRAETEATREQKQATTALQAARRAVRAAEGPLRGKKRKWRA